MVFTGEYLVGIKHEPHNQHPARRVDYRTGGGAVGWAWADVKETT